MSAPIQKNKPNDSRWLASLLGAGTVLVGLGVLDPEEPPKKPSVAPELHNAAVKVPTNKPPAGVITNLGLPPPQQSQRQP